MFGFLFEDDAEAARFLRKVSTHVRTSAAGERRHRAPSTCSPLTVSHPLGSLASRKGTVARKISLGLGVGRQARRLTPGMVSGPAKGTFVHVGHVGFDDAGRVEASDSVEPGWAVMLGELSGGRIDGLDGFFKGVPTSTPKVAAGPLKSDGTPLRGTLHDLSVDLQRLISSSPNQAPRRNEGRSIVSLSSSLLDPLEIPENSRRVPFDFLPPKLIRVVRDLHT